MCKPFVKSIRSDLVLYLITKNANAYAILAYVAHTAPYETGECKIKSSDFECMSRQQYRDALSFLEKNQLVTISGTISGTKGGTIIKIADDSVWDINPDITKSQKNHQRNQLENQRPTNSPPAYTRVSTQEEERITKEIYKNNNARDPSKNEKVFVKIREWVRLTQEQIDTFMAKHPAELANLMLDLLDGYNTSRQKHYPSDYGALKNENWVHKKALEELEKSKQKIMKFETPYQGKFNGRYQPNPTKSSIDESYFKPRNHIILGA
jgi:hypothetical protein